MYNKSTEKPDELRIKSKECGYYDDEVETFNSGIYLCIAISVLLVGATGATTL